jgi:nucleoside-diphosphate-sugar epimerase
MALPGKESAPRHPGANFYWSQEDLVRERSEAANWSFTIMRPQIVCGQALGSPMNIINAIGVYAAVRRHLGAPFSFPGGGGFVTEMTDTRLLARAIVWAGGNPRCYGETLNITNGDVVEWESIWPDLASHFGMTVGPAEPQQLSAVMPPLAHVWDEVTARHGLQRRTMEEVVGLSWQFADAVFGAGGTGRSTLLSTIKSRQLGFTDCIDSAQMFREHFAILEASGMLPRP